MYREFDKLEDVTNKDNIIEALDNAVEKVLQMKDIRDTELMKSHVFYSLLLALVLIQENWETLKASDNLEGVQSAPISEAAERNLLALAAALAEPEVYVDYEEFTEASETGTNVKAQRVLRIRWLATALTEGSI